MSSTEITREARDWGRAYIVKNEGKIYTLPSVTTILKLNVNKKFEKLEKQFGKTVWDGILDRASERGNVLHKMLEIFLISWAKDRVVEKALQEAQEFAISESKISTEHNKAVKKGRSLFWNFYNGKFWEGIEEVVENEIFLWTLFRGGWAGTADFIFRNVNGNLIIIDFKSSTSLKSEEDVLNYKIQISAYMFMAAERYQEIPEMGEIWIANEKTDEIQKFVVRKDEFKVYLRIFLELLEKFKNIHNLN